MSSHDPQELRRGLDNRHVQLMAIGGAIGTGLFMGSGKTISLAGPSIVITYAVIGFMLFFVMRAMGELLLSNTQYKSFIDFASDLLGDWAGYFVGWTYWLCWIVTAVADVIGIASYVHFWLPDLNSWLPVLSAILLFLALNLAAVKLFGELEFWFALIKIVAIAGLIVLGLYMIATGFTSPTGTTASFANFWNHGDLFPKGLMGFFAGFQIAVFAFVGIELAGTTAAEVKNPEKNLPKAINSIPLRIIFFYVFSLIIIMSVSPWDQIVPEQSPFVTMFVLAGIPIAASLVNFVVLTSASSAANSGVFSTSRMLYGLAEKKVIPACFAKLSSNSVPANALIFSCLCVLLAYGVLSLMPTAMAAFTVITTVAAILFIFVWSIILISYMVYRRRSPELHAKSNFKMPGGIVMCYVVLSFFAFILVLLTLEKDTLTALLYTPLWFVLLAFGYYLSTKKRKTA
ncbi:D-serine/D-alanine/glycine transporter [Acinetobacter sp. HY1485]|uniref:D-serine/D-alanine/glycine transporter n=1 Tax=Acinetobacter sp. HY1485 TaxID=2970918 RepID=UPI0022B9699B|nr:D-serine/D-alanine/glycine transporter [Acinetobacter sp. HY1485]